MKQVIKSATNIAMRTEVEALNADEGGASTIPEAASVSTIGLSQRPRTLL